MKGPDLLLRQLYNNPAQQEYFIQLYIYGLSEQGKFLLVLGKNEKPNNIRETANLCDKVKIGETLEQAVRRTISQEIGIVEILKITPIDKYDSAPNRLGGILPRVTVEVSLKYQDIPNKKFQELYFSWFPIEQLTVTPNEKNIAVNKTVLSETDIEDILNQITKLNYFKFVSEENFLKAKKEIEESLRESSKLDSWISSEDKNGFYTLVRREYITDSEDLAEGGMLRSIEEMKWVLNKEGVIIETLADNFNEENYYLYINKKPYFVFKENKGEYDWNIAHRRLLEIINELLIQAGSKERLYWQYGGNDACSIFLTEELYKYIISLPLDKNWLPHTAEELENNEF